MKTQKLTTKLFLATLALTVSASSYVFFDNTISKTSYAETSAYHYENVDITNSSFTSGSSNNITGWTRIGSYAGATMQTIKYNETTRLKEMPGKTGLDNKVLMINSAEDNTDFKNSKSAGYKSNEITLQANSNFVFQISMRTMDLDPNFNSFGSIYIDGLKDGNKSQSFAFKNKINNDWQSYYFFIQTGNDEQKINLELWLGNREQESSGAVFFDEILCTKLSQNEYESRKTRYQTNYTNNVQELSLTTALDATLNASKYNFDFESNTGWESSSGNVIIKNLEGGIDGTSMNPGLDFSASNTKALTLDLSEKGVKTAKQTEDIAINRGEIYKITLNAKSDYESGVFKLIITEQNTVINNVPQLEDIYNVHTKEIEINKTEDNAFKNDYEEIVVFVKGHELYDSSIRLGFYFENKSTSEGYAVVDNIKIEKATSKQYDDASNQLSLQSGKAEGKIENSIFNFTEIEDIDNILHKPENWIIKTSNTLNSSGVVNSMDMPSNLGSSFPTTNSPVDVYGYNNVFVFKNIINENQSLKNESAINLEKGKYYNISFDYFTTNNTGIDFSVTTDEDLRIFNENDIQTNGSWQNFSCYLYSGEAEHDVFVNLGYDEIGFAFVDNFKIEESLENNYKNATHKSDLSNFYLNIENDIDNAPTKHPAFIETTTRGTAKSSGIINGNYNTIFKNADDEAIDQSLTNKNNILILQSKNDSISSLKSKFTVKVDENSYYKLSFKLYTNFADISTLPTHDKNNKEIDYDFGVTVGLDTFEKTQNISSKDNWQEFEIFYKSLKSEDANLIFELISYNNLTAGTAFLTDIKFEESSEGDFESCKLSNSINNTVFACETAAEVDNDTDDEDEETENTSPTKSDINWLLIPSIITGAAVLVAVIGGFIRKLNKGKKQTKKQKEAYDRLNSVEKDQIEKESLKQQEIDINDIKKGIENTKLQIKKLEDTHNDYVEAKRKDNGSQITKEIEITFKRHLAQKAKLNKMLEIMQENLNNAKSSEYLMKLQNKIASNLNKKNKK